MSIEEKLQKLILSRRVEQNDATLVYRQPIVKPAKAVRRNKNEAFVPDYRSSYQIKRDQRAAQEYRTKQELAEEEAKQAEALDQLMSLTMPSTYLEAAIGEKLDPGAKFLTDAVGYSAPGLLRQAGKNILKRAVKNTTSAVNNRQLATLRAIEEDPLLQDGLHTYPLNSGRNSVDIVKGYPYYSKSENPISPKLIEPHRAQLAQPELLQQDAGLYRGRFTDINDIKQFDLLDQLPVKDIKDLGLFVDEAGNVNMRTLTSAIKDFYKSHPNARSYKDVLNSSGNLYLHIKDVVKSAQEIPVPEGYTRQQLVQAALFHDIGKVFGSGKHSHGPVAVEMLKSAGYNLDPAVENAIKNHMSGSMLDRDQLTRALHFADVARGESWDLASFKYPHLAYDYPKLKLDISKLPLREELKTRINPWLRNKGYKTIDLNSSEELAWNELEDRINQHLSFLRGVRDPVKTNITSADDARNAVNSILQTMDEYGLGFDYASSPEASQYRMRNAATHTTLSPTAHDRRSNLYSDALVDGRTEYERTRYSDMIGANPKTRDGLYLSTSDDVANLYATTNTDSRAGAAYIVRLPKHERIPGESMSEHLLRNDFDMISTQNLEGQRRGFGSMYEDPYRLQTGRSLQSDMRKEGLLKPEYKRDYSSIIFPGDYDSKTSTGYGDIIDRLNKTNEALQQLGISFRFKPTESGAIVKPLKLRNLSYDIQDLAKAKHTLQEGRYLLEVEKGVNGHTTIKYPLIPSEPPIPNPERKAIAEYALQIDPEDLYKDAPDPSVMAELMEDEPKRNFFAYGRFPKEEFLRLKDSKLITKKQYFAIKNAYLHGGDPFKYIDFKRLANNKIDEYLKLVKGKKARAYTPDYKTIKLDPEEMANFMRKKGAVPRYETEGYGDNRVFVIDANEKNKTINAGDIERTYGYVIGKKGEKVVDIVEEVPHKTIKNPNHINKDSGSYSKRKISRKTLRGLIPPIIAASAIKNKKDDKK